jgi:uncharacterized protein involved in exopolysaccharide biosynthesis/protein involved in polysaccharide export with SLBB domain
VGEDNERQMLGMDALAQTEAQILNSADLVEEVINEIGVENIYPALIGLSPEGPTAVPGVIGPPPKEPKAVDDAIIQSATFRFKGNLAAYAIKGSPVINVSFKHSNPQIAARAVNQLVESFKEKHIEIFKNPRTPFMENQLAIYRQRLQESEKALEAFKRKNKVFDLAEQRSLLIKQQSGINYSTKETQTEILQLKGEISSITSQLQTIPKYELSSTDKGKSKNIDDAQHKLLNLQIQEQELLAKYDGGNRRIANVRKEIHLLEDYLAHNGLKEVTAREVLAKNSTYTGLETSLLKAQTRLSVQEVKIAAIGQQLKQVNDELQYLDSHEMLLRNLERELQTNETNYQNYVSKLEDARAQDELDLLRQVNISVIQKATVPLGPIEPRKRFNLLVGLILGAVSGLALAIFSEYCIGRGVCTPESIEHDLGLPILAAVSYKEQNKTRTLLTMFSFASLFFLLIMLNACSTAVKSPTPFNPRVVQEPSDSKAEYTIHESDELNIKFFYNPELSESVTVRPDGRISMQFASEVMAAGLTPAELTAILTEIYSAEFVDPQITVIVRSYGGQLAYVDGEVSKPHYFDLHKIGSPLTVSQAIAKAGGLRDTARRHEVRVIRRNTENKPFVIPVNLDKVWNGTDVSQDIVLQPYDIVYVPKSTIANVNLWMKQYIYNNFPQRGYYFTDFTD